MTSNRKRHQQSFLKGTNHNYLVIIFIFLMILSWKSVSKCKILTIISNFLHFFLLFCLIVFMSYWSNQKVVYKPDQIRPIRAMICFTPTTAASIVFKTPCAPKLGKRSGWPGEPPNFPVLTITQELKVLDQVYPRTVPSKPRDMSHLVLMPKRQNFRHPFLRILLNLLW